MASPRGPRMAEVDAQSGAVLARFDLRFPTDADASAMRGPRGLAMTPDGARLYVLNKIANTITTIDPVSREVLTEIPAGSNDPTPPEIRRGRGFLFDARLSGNGTVSCATCHLDADRDGLAWDQGDPDGEMVTMKGAFLSAHIFTLEDRVMHPMKGPMVTQTLIGMGGNVTPLNSPAQAVTSKFHWRGDKPSLQSFNSTFDKLMGGAEIPATDMDALAAYLMTLRHHPNPNRNPDRTLPTALGNGNPVRGRDMFNTHEKSHCMMCHALPAGTDQNIDRKLEVNGTQEMKNPPLRTVYHRAGLYNPAVGGISLSGFGLGSDGTGHEMPKVHFYQLDNLNKTQELRDMTAFLMCFDTGTAPAVGRSITFDHARKSASAVTAEFVLLESRSTLLSGDCDLVLRGKIGGTSRSFRYLPSSNRYISDRAGETPLTRAALLALIQAGDSATLMGVLPGNGPRLGGDRNNDGVSDGNDLPPALSISPVPQTGSVEVKWPGPSADWYPETSESPAGPWVPMTAPSELLPDGEAAAWSPGQSPRRFFRLRSTR